MQNRLTHAPLNLGGTPNDGGGDSLREGGAKINANMQAVFDRLNFTPDPALFRQIQDKLGPYLYGRVASVVNARPIMERTTFVILTVGNSHGVGQGTTTANQPGEQLKRVLQMLAPEADFAHYNYAVPGSWQTQMRQQIDAAVNAGIRPDFVLVLDPANDGLTSIYHALEGPVVYRSVLANNISYLQRDLNAIVLNHTSPPPHPTWSLTGPSKRFDFSPDFFTSFPTTSWVAGQGYQGFTFNAANRTIETSTKGQFTIFSPGWVVPGQWIRFEDDGSFHHIVAVDDTGTVLTVDDGQNPPGPSFTQNRFTQSAARIARIDAKTQLVPARNNDDLSRPDGVPANVPLSLEYRDINDNGLPILVSTRHMTLNQICREVTLEQGAVLVDWAAEFQRRLKSDADYDSLYFDDYHPNADGYLILTEIYKRIFTAILYGHELKDREIETIIYMPAPTSTEGAARDAALSLAATFPQTMRGDLIESTLSPTYAASDARLISIATRNPAWMVDGGAAVQYPAGQYNLGLIATVAFVDAEVWEIQAEVENTGTVAASAAPFLRTMDANFNALASVSFPSAGTIVTLQPGEKRIVRGRFGRGITTDNMTVNLSAATINARAGLLVNRQPNGVGINSQAQMKIRALSVRSITSERRAQDSSAAALIAPPSLPWAPGISPDQFTRARAGNPSPKAAAAIVTLDNPIVDDVDLGATVEFSGLTGHTCFTRGVMPITPGRVYEISVTLKLISSSGPVTFRVAGSGLDAAFQQKSTFDQSNPFTLSAPGIGRWSHLLGTELVSGPGQSKLDVASAYFRGGFRLGSTADAQLNYRVSEVRVTDVTDRLASVGGATSAGLSAESSRLALVASFPAAISADLVTLDFAVGAPSSIVPISKSAPTWAVDNGASILPPKANYGLGMVGSVPLVAGETYEVVADIENVGTVGASTRMFYTLMNSDYSSQSQATSGAVSTLAAGERATIRRRFGKGIAASADTVVMPDAAVHVRTGLQINRQSGTTTADPNAQMKIRALYIRNVTSEVKAAAAAAAGRPVPFAQQVHTAGNGTAVNSTSYVSLGNINDLTVAAKEGDLIDIEINCQAADTTAGDIHWNVMTVAAGAERAMVSPGRIAGWLIPSGQSAPLSGRYRYLVQAADITNGNVTLRLKAKMTAGGFRSIFGSADVPFEWSIANLGTRA